MGALVMGFGHERTAMIGHQAALVAHGGFVW